MTSEQNKLSDERLAYLANWSIYHCLPGGVITPSDSFLDDPEEIHAILTELLSRRASAGGEAVAYRVRMDKPFGGVWQLRHVLHEWEHWDIIEPLYAAPAPSPAPVVRELEWTPNPWGQPQAVCAGVGYTLESDGRDKWVILLNGRYMHPKVHGVIQCFGLDEAKAVAQADFIARILSALHSKALPDASEVDPVVWGDAGTVGNMIAQLRTFDPNTPIHGAFHGEYQGKRRPFVRGLTMSRERVNGRKIEQGNEEVPYSVVVWSAPENDPEARAPAADYEVIGTTADGVDVLAPVVSSKNFTREEVQNALALSMSRLTEHDISRLTGALRMINSPGDSDLADKVEHIVATDLIVCPRCEIALKRSDFSKHIDRHIAVAGFLNGSDDDEETGL